MFEVWADKARPETRLVVRQGSGLPADLGPRDWLLLGAIDPGPEVARTVDATGFAFVHSDEPVIPSDQLKNSNAGGA